MTHQSHPGSERDQHAPAPKPKAPGRTTPVPGLSAFTAVISNTCRQGRGDEGAIDEALVRLRAAMVDTIARWPQDKGATFFVTFTVDRDGRRELYESQAQSPRAGNTGYHERQGEHDRS